MNAEYKRPKRVGKRDVVDQADAVPLADSESGRAPLADPVEGHDRRLIERAGEKRTGGMALVMVGEDQPGPGRAAQAAAQGPPHVQLVLEPERHGQPKAAKSARSIGQVGLQQPLELGQRLVVERDVVQIGRRQPRLRRQ